MTPRLPRRHGNNSSQSLVVHGESFLSMVPLFSATDGSTRPGHLREWRWPMAERKHSRRQEQITLSRSRSPCNSSMTANTSWWPTSTASGCLNWGLNRRARRVVRAIIIRLLLNHEPENWSCVQPRNVVKTRNNMPMRQISSLRFICAFFLTWIVGIESASARILRVWTMDEIADKAEVLLVGEIVEISAVEKIDADKTRWNTPLLRMAAKIRVLRTFKRNGAPAIQQAKQIVLVYEVADWERG